MQAFQGLQEAVAQRCQRTVRELDALAGQFGAHLCALQAAQIARQPDPHEQVVAVALARRGQAGQLQAAHARLGPAAGRTTLADFAGAQWPGREGDQNAGVTVGNHQRP